MVNSKIMGDISDSFEQDTGPVLESLGQHARSATSPKRALRALGLESHPEYCRLKAECRDRALDRELFASVVDILYHCDAATLYSERPMPPLGASPEHAPGIPDVARPWTVTK